ncbi:PIN domain-containing protein [Paraclostridium sordellii]|uniref:PIN domain-containing protein n=1 Tax=Paraclostridium sordellii TaxID=1505 RepID=UPI000385C009|nr:PIN domain-containing protein [Paeniclostridium sordellii]EPZ57772.1 hypothetical protein H476_1256 [[Clostridium] sordellii VPI 9048] [Paeniclostridium sordellii VPI 9048]CEK37660.1 hypothetical protein JGS6382_09921 [[Clostridium] sordellii] [Paeniclostridium sordellii]
MISKLFASVSVDTNVFIHLYKSGCEDLLFEFFNKVCVHEYIVETELKNNDIDTYKKVKEEIKDKRIILYTNRDIVKLGLINSFNEQFEDYKILFAGDLGEAYAVALSSAIGIPSFVSDDIKHGGPHETLVKGLIENVMPFAFYELLFIKYLKEDMYLEQLKYEFDIISNTMKKPMQFKSKMNETMRRFLIRNERDKLFIKECSKIHKINVKEKVTKLREFINKV